MLPVQHLSPPAKGQRVQHQGRGCLGGRQEVIALKLDNHTKKHAHIMLGYDYENKSRE